MKNWLVYIFINALLFDVNAFFYFSKKQDVPPLPIDGFSQLSGPKESEPPPSRAKPAISTQIPNYLNYGQIHDQLEKWKVEASDLVETGVYGSTSRGTPCRYIRVGSLQEKSVRKVLLIHGCIHGNEPLATAEVMAWCGSLLGSYGTDEAVTELLNTRDIYFVPVLSPDSYPHSRYVEGVDPNRDFPGPRDPNHKSCSPLRAIQDLFLKIRPSAVLSGHTFGRVYLTPYGDTNVRCANEPDFLRVIKVMQGFSGYRHQHACEMYGRPIFGSELDWYYRSGQGSFAIVCEFGTHQQIPSPQDIKEEFNRTYKAFLHFAKEAPLVDIHAESRIGLRRAFSLN